MGINKEMTTEERLAKIHVRVAKTYIDTQHDREWLLELVDSYAGMIVELNQEITHYCNIAEELQERVREVELNEANSEHMPKAGDLL